METGMSSAIGGIQWAMQTHAARAERISKASLTPEEGGDITKDMAEMQLDPAAVKANAATLKTQDKMLGALMDLFA
jgi:hypothetical protein